MVAHLVRLKLTLLRNGLRRSPWQVVALVLAGLSGLWLVGLAGAGLVALRWVPVDVAAAVVTLAGSLLVLGWAVVPLLAFGVDETLDPARFATFSIRRAPFMTGLLLAGVVGVPGIVTLVLGLLTAVTWSRSGPAAALAVVCAVLATLTAVAASRATTTAAAALLSTRRARDAVVLVVGLLLVGLGPALNLLGARAVQYVEVFRTAAGVAGWTPLGFAWAAPADAAAGRWGSALLRTALAAATLALVLLAWSAALTRAEGRPAVGGRRAGDVRAGSGDRLLARLPATPAVAVAARCLAYWRRDPRYLMAGASVLVLPLLLVVLPLGTGIPVGPVVTWAGPVTAFALGWALHDDVAYDHSAFWLHLSAGLSGRDDRLGRVLGAALWQVPLVLVVTLAGTAVGGRWDLLPALLGLAGAVYCAGLAVSSVSSALAPYPVSAPGASPFATPRGAAVATLVAQSITTALVTLLALPSAVLAVLAVTTGAWLGWLGLLAALVLSPVWLRLGVRRGGALVDRRGPELLAAVSRS
ncbi:transporter [Kineococcus sp. NUM-3379]